MLAHGNIVPYQKASHSNCSSIKLYSLTFSLMQMGPRSHLRITSNEQSNFVAFSK